MDQKNNEEQGEVMKLLQENNKLLKKIHRQNLIGLWFKVLWFAILVGLPFAAYFYFIQPYFEAFGADYEVFRDGVSQIPGLKGLESILPSFTE